MRFASSTKNEVLKFGEVRSSSLTQSLICNQGARGLHYRAHPLESLEVSRGHGRDRGEAEDDEAAGHALPERDGRAGHHPAEDRLLHRKRVQTRVERFRRRGTEPFEPFEPFEFFQNSGIFARKIKKIQKFQKFSTFSKLSAKFRQNLIKI